MTDRGRFRNQDPDHQYDQDDYPTGDEMSSAMGGHDAPSMHQGQGGYPGQDESTADLHRGMGGRLHEEDLYGEEEIDGTA